MSDNKVYVELSGKETNLIDLIRKMNDGFDEGAAKAAQESKETAALGREAKRVLGSIQTDQEKRTAQLERLNVLREKGMLNEEQYGRAVANVKGQQDGLLDSMTASIFKANMLGEAQEFIVQGLDAEIERRKEIAQLQEAAAPNIGKLLQLADTEEGGKALMKRAAEVRASGAANSLGEAAELVFSVENAGFGDQLELVKRIGVAQLFASADEAMSSANQIQKAFGTAEAGNLKQILAKGLAGASNMNATAEQFMAAMARTSGPGGMIGASDEEVGAVVNAIGDTVGIERAGEVAGGLMKSLIKKGFAGKPVGQAVTEIAAMNLSPVEMLSYLGEASAVEGFGAISKPENLQRYMAARQMLTDANSGAPVDTKLAISEKLTRASIARRQQEGRVETEMVTEFGDSATLLEAIRNEDKHEVQRRYGAWSGYLLSKLDEFQENTSFFGNTNRMIRHRLQRVMEGERMDPELGSTAAAHLNELKQINAQQLKTLQGIFEWQRQQRKAMPSALPATEK